MITSARVLRFVYRVLCLLIANLMPFIVFDGLDAGGKSSQCELLKQELERRGKEVEVIHHPTHTGLGRIIRDTLFVKNQRFGAWPEAFLYAADQAETLARVIYPAYKTGKYVLVHRWLFSSLVYQVLDGAEFCDVNELSKLASAIVCPDTDEGYYVYPDHSFLFVVDPKVACDRIAARTGEETSPYENLEKLQKGYDMFKQLSPLPIVYDSSQQPWHYTQTEWLGDRTLVDTTIQTPEETHKLIVDTLEDACLL